MSSKGSAETQILRANISDQLNRLFTQLEDLEELKNEFSTEEYNEIKQETMSQLADFQQFLNDCLKGDLTLMDEFASANLALQQAVASAFHTPEILRLFADKQPDALRIKFDGLKRDFTLAKIAQTDYVREAGEILTALSKLGSALTLDEDSLLKQYHEIVANTSNESFISFGNDTDAERIVDEKHQVSFIHQARSQAHANRSGA